MHRDPSSGKRSYKERVALNGAEAAALAEALPLGTSTTAATTTATKKGGGGDDDARCCPPSSSSRVPSLAAAALRVALGPGAVPLLRTEADRTAFECVGGGGGGGGEGGLRVTVDERVRMSAAVEVGGGGGRGGWLFEDGGGDSERPRRLLFPFTIVEVKLAG